MVLDFHPSDPKLPFNEWVDGVNAIVRGSVRIDSRAVFYVKWVPDDPGFIRCYAVAAERDGGFAKVDFWTVGEKHNDRISGLASYALQPHTIRTAALEIDGFLNHGALPEHADRQA